MKVLKGCPPNRAKLAHEPRDTAHDPPSLHHERYFPSARPIVAVSTTWIHPTFTQTAGTLLGMAALCWLDEEGSDVWDDDCREDDVRRDLCRRQGRREYELCCCVYIPVHPTLADFCGPHSQSVSDHYGFSMKAEASLARMFLGHPSTLSYSVWPNFCLEAIRDFCSQASIWSGSRLPY